MRAYLETTVTPRMKVYDSKAPASGFLADLLSPVISITDDDDKLLYVYGEYKESSFGLYVISAACVAFILFLIKKRR